MKYKANKGLTRDERGKKGKDNFVEGKYFAPGDIFSDSDFPKAVIKNWLELGIAKKVKPKKKDIKDGK